jgi:hypothetical protein
MVAVAIQCSFFPSSLLILISYAKAVAAIAVAAVALTRIGSWKIHAWRSAVLFN